LTPFDDATNVFRSSTIQSDHTVNAFGPGLDVWFFEVRISGKNLVLS